MSTDTTEEDFNAADTILIEALGSGRTHAQAAKLARVSSKTVQRRLQDLDFARAVAERRRRRVDDVTAQLVAAADDAISVLTTLLGSPIGSERLRAAQLLLDYGHRYHRVQLDAEILERIAGLEEALNQPSASRAERRGASDEGDR